MPQPNIRAQRTLPPTFTVVPEPQETGIHARGGVLQETDYCYGRYSREGIYYFGKITGIENEEADVEFFDGLTDHIQATRLFTIEEAFANLQPFANWNHQGGYYPCSIIAKGKDMVTVRYDEDQQIEETIPYERLRFVSW